MRPGVSCCLGSKGRWGVMDFLDVEQASGVVGFLACKGRPRPAETLDVKGGWA
jgi:hypothetical protein